MIRNIIVGQSGGPTAVINASLAGVYKTAKDLGVGKVYGMRHGIQGFLERKIVDLDEKLNSELNVELLKRTPSAYLGSCRFKLPEIGAAKEIYDTIFTILKEYEIDAFFYIGGNDSMDTIIQTFDFSSAQRTILKAFKQKRRTEYSAYNNQKKNNKVKLAKLIHKRPGYP